jgi:ribonuclease Y
VSVETIAYVVLGLAVLGLGALGGWLLRGKSAEKKVVESEKFAEKIVHEAKREAETEKKRLILEAKDEWYKAKAKFEKDTQSTRVQLQRDEKKLNDRERDLNRRADLLERKEKELRVLERDLEARDKAVEEKGVELERLIKEQNTKLERIANLSMDEAKQLLMVNMENEAKHSAAKLIGEIRENALRDAEKEARKIITLAVQRLAADHVVESTVSVVNLPNDEMKGRIIGREGRNIRAFETVAGIDVIIDDTPEAVILSGFDPVRREIARRAMEKLVLDGRIHPTRIEEVVEKTHKEVESEIREIGEQAAIDVGVTGLHPEVIRLLGRLRYRTSYGQNVLQHSKEVAFLSSVMAAELGIDESLAKRAGLLHDLGKAVDHEREGTHASIGKELLERYNEPPTIIEAVAFHHETVDGPNTLISVLVQAADAISGARPGARRETLETYVKRLLKLEHIADSFPGVEKAYAIQAGREIRILVENKKVDDTRANALASEIARKVEKEMEYPGQIKVVVIRETRATDYAR